MKRRKQKEKKERSVIWQKSVYIMKHTHSVCKDMGMQSFRYFVFRPKKKLLHKNPFYVYDFQQNKFSCVAVIAFGWVYRHVIVWNTSTDKQQWTLSVLCKRIRARENDAVFKENWCEKEKKMSEWWNEKDPYHSLHSRVPSHRLQTKNEQ